MNEIHYFVIGEIYTFTKKKNTNRGKKHSYYLMYCRTEYCTDCLVLAFRMLYSAYSTVNSRLFLTYFILVKCLRGTIFDLGTSM